MADKKRDQPIPADQATAAKPWRLPFWTETPQWAIERDRAEAAEQQQSHRQVATADASAYDDEELSLPTAEELENIRRDAYNAGLEQGLVEGRQQGHQEGLTQGLSQGKSEGYQQGYKQGQQEGRAAGEQQGLQVGQAAIDQQVQQVNGVLLQLQRALHERDQALPSVLTELIRLTCERVLEQELTTGAERISAYIDQALQQLPMGKEDVQVFVSPADHEYLAHSPALKQRLVIVHIDEQLANGHVRVETEDSLIEYASRARLEQALDHLQPILLKACSDFPSTEEQEQALMEGMAAHARIEGAESESAESESVESVTDDEALATPHRGEHESQ